MLRIWPTPYIPATFQLYRQLSTFASVVWKTLWKIHVIPYLWGWLHYKTDSLEPNVPKQNSVKNCRDIIGLRKIHLKFAS